MKARVKWVENRVFLGESETGHTLVMGSGVASPCPSPMELVLLGTGGCTAFDVVNILEKGREPITDCVVEMEAGVTMTRRVHSDSPLGARAWTVPSLRWKTVASPRGSPSSARASV